MGLTATADSDRLFVDATVVYTVTPMAEAEGTQMKLGCCVPTSDRMQRGFIVSLALRADEVMQ